MAELGISDWVKKARAWTSATKMNEAEKAFNAGGFGNDVAQIGRQIAGLYEGMRYGAEDAADQYDARSVAARKAMLDQFAQTDANTQAAYANSRGYQSEIAKRLGLEGVLQGPGVENQNQQMNQLLAMNKVNRTNQLSSYDLLRGGYGELLRDRLGSFDVGAGTTMAGLMAQLAALKAEAAKGGGGGGGRGGGGGSDEEGDLSAFAEGQETYPSFNPFNMPQNKTAPMRPYPADVIERRAMKKYNQARSRKTLGKTSRAYSIAHKKG